MMNTRDVALERALLRHTPPRSRRSRARSSPVETPLSSSSGRSYGSSASMSSSSSSSSSSAPPTLRARGFTGGTRFAEQENKLFAAQQENSMLHGGGGHDSGGGGGKTLPARLAQRLFEAYVQQSDAAEVERETIVATRPGRRRNELHPLPIAAAHLDAARAAVEAHAADVASMRPVTSLRSSSTELIWAKRAQVLEETNARLVSEMRRCRAAEADAAQQLVHAEEMQKQLLLRADEVVAQLQRQNRQNMERAHAETEAALRRAVVSAAASSNAVLQQRRLPDALEASSSAQTARQQNAVDVDEFTRLAEEKVEMQRQHEIDLAYVGEQFESALEEALAERAADDAASRRAELAQLEAEARAMTARLVATEKTAKESDRHLPWGSIHLQRAVAAAPSCS